MIALACLAVLYGLYVTEHARLGVFPEFAPPQVVIQTEAAGFSPEQVETLVTQRIENNLVGTVGLESIRSQSIQGLSVVTVVFQGGTDIYQARQMVGERLLAILSQMPQGAAAPTMAPLTSATAVIMDCSISPGRSAMELRTFADWTLRPRLIGGAGRGEGRGCLGGEVRLTADPGAARSVWLAFRSLELPMCWPRRGLPRESRGRALWRTRAERITTADRGAGAHGGRTGRGGADAA